MRKLMLLVFEKQNKVLVHLFLIMMCRFLFICVNLYCFYFGTKTQVKYDMESIYFVPFHYLGFYVLCICILSFFSPCILPNFNKCELNFNSGLLLRREVHLRILLSKFAKSIHCPIAD